MESSSLAEVSNIIPPLPLNAASTGKAAGSNRLAGKQILVVGGGQSANVEDTDHSPPIGNGRAICILLAREGAIVLIADKSRSAAEATAALVAKEGKSEPKVLVGDVSNPDGCAALAKEALELSKGRLDGLVLSVGIVGSGSNLLDSSVEEWDQVMNVSLRSHFLIAREIVPYMARQATGGSVVSVGSISQLQPMSNAYRYHASKAGLDALIKKYCLRICT